MRSLLVVVLCVASAFAVDQELWDAWKAKHGKTYETEVEERYRMKVFDDNAKIVMQHNLEESLGLHTFTLGLNIFADLTNEEFRAIYLPRAQAPQEHPDAQQMTEENVSTPATQDWRDQGAVTSVKDQGQCGSCWSFSATGGIEGQYYLKYGTLNSYSEQQMVDCNTHDYGCNGGNSANCFTYWKTTGPNLEADYAYTAKDGTCHTSDYKQYTKTTGYVAVQKYSESALQSAVGNVCPVSVAIDASHNSFQLYSSGIYYEPKCSQYSLDHAVLTVGYNSNSDGDYWIVKNSWGTSWGQQGYIWMSRNKSNNCGIASDATYPTY